MVVIIGQLIFTVIAGMYFYGALKNQRNTRSAGTLESSRAMERIQRMRKVKLTEPLAEKDVYKRQGVYNMQSLKPCQQ